MTTNNDNVNTTNDTKGLSDSPGEGDCFERFKDTLAQMCASEPIRLQLDDRDIIINRLQKENAKLKGVLNYSLKAINYAYEECSCEQQNLIKAAKSCSEKVREYKELARKLIDP